MIDFAPFYQQIAASRLSPWLEVLPAQLARWQRELLHGHFTTWYNAVHHLPTVQPHTIDLTHAVVARGDLNERQRTAVEKLLRQLLPWRKGPFTLYDIHIDAEWDCNHKWQRLLPHIAPLTGRQVLDVGCGNGYYLWRMLGNGAERVIGIDPMQLFLCQFEAVRKLLGGEQRAQLLPLGIEQLPELGAFDTVFCMGVLYHRRSPFDFLLQLKQQLVRGGELVLETLVVPGDETCVLVPPARYAKMRNVWFIPSAAALQNWLAKCDFVDIRVVDQSSTTLQEQRRTSWMLSESLAQFLHPHDARLTVEGHPAPCRAILIARKP